MHGSRSPRQHKRVPLETPPTLAESLTQQFYAWEQLGRGWLLWNYPVELEPPFVPFRGFAPPPLPPGYDDGRKPTLLASLAGRLRDAVAGSRHDPEPAELLERLDEPEPYRFSAAPREIRIAVPADLVIVPQAAEDLLRGLPVTPNPLVFEIIGNGDGIVIQLACAIDDERGLTQQLRAHFPDAVLNPASVTLREMWTRCPGTEPVFVDFALAHEFMLPLRTFRRFDVDPLTGIVGALSEIGRNEIAMLQVLLRPVRHPWSASIMRSVTDASGRPFFADAPQITKLAEDKVARPLFAAVVRLAAKSPNVGNAWQLVRLLGGALKALGEPSSNELMPLTNEGYDAAAHEEDLLSRQTRRSGFLLNSAELVGLVHPPGASVRVEKLVRYARRTRSAPQITTGHSLVLGTNVHAGKRIDVSLNADQRTQHTYVIGASGTGKSTLLLNLILQDLEHGEGLAVLDPHGDLIDEVLRRMPQNRVADVCLLDPADAEYPVGFNILSAHTELERTLLASDLVAVFQRLSTRWGDQMTSVLGNAILAILESDSGGTLVDLRRFLVEAQFRRDFLTTVRDPDVVYYWQREFPLLAGKPQAPLLTRLDTFLRPKPIRYMVAQKEGLDFGTFMNDGKVLLARLSQGAIGEENAYLLGTLLVSKFQQIAMSRQELAASDRRPFYLYIDEFQNFVTPSMAAILSGARKYRLGLVLAHQDLQQLGSRDPQVLNSVISNPYTRVCFRVGDHDARRLEEGFASFTAQDLQNLGTGQAIVRVERSDFDFNLDTPPLQPLPAGVPDARDGVVASSRSKYARRREEVEALLREATSQPEPAEEPAPRLQTAAEKPRSRAKDQVGSARQIPPQGRPRPEPLPEVALPHGRGGRQHKYLQELIRRWAEAHEWRADVEETVLDGLGNVDVALRKGDHSVACEISISTSPEHELENIQKCFAAGFERVAVVSSEKATLGRIRKVVRERLEDAEQARVHYVQPEELFTFLEELEAEPSATETTVRGYKVKVQYQRVGEAEKASKREAVSRVIAKALGRLKGKT